MAADANIPQSIEHLFRHESGKMLAVLVKLFGFRQVEIAEDIVQDTLLAAFESWKLGGIPDQPRAWLYRTAKNKAIDFLRRERNFKDNVAPAYLQRELRDEVPKQKWLDHFFGDQEIEDAQLRMMFACCDDTLSVENQLALMLRTLCGLSVREIAVALLLPEDTVGKRLLRTKEKLKAQNATLEVPMGAALAPRLDAVLQAIYLLFSEGYKSNTENSIIRRELCDDALRLCHILARHPATNLPKTHALLSLICFQASRFDARLDPEGRIILLEKQDRGRWNQPLITLGYQHLGAASSGKQLSEYHLEAAIASYHASAPDFEQTNWKGIFFCYDLLYKINASPFVALNRAIALGYADGPKAGIAALLNISELRENHSWHLALGDFYHKNKEKAAAETAYRAALQLARLPAEQILIQQKIQAVLQDL